MNSFTTALERLNKSAGFAAAVLVLCMVFMQFFVVLLRHVFGFTSIVLSESIWYMNGAIFMVGAGYTLLMGAHVRIDVFYSAAAPRTQAIINILGVFLFLAPVAFVTLYLSLPYVLNSWAILEGSTEISGLPLIFILKTIIPIFAVLVSLEGIRIVILNMGALTDVRRSPIDGDAE